GQSWEIDEPGYVSGDIIDNFTAGAFDNANSVDIMFPDDVAMGMGWDFTLKAYEKAVITFLLGEEIPEGFYLAHTDPDSQETVYFSTTLGISGDSPAIPEPGTVLLLGTGLLGLAGIRKKFAGRV
ncbi:MAG: PEP-CTERM sorting domain-containing protein, partial [Desulfobacteraceae bacterium]|nr:PEP-CTERM sorting domain-containing protein [Desulfobacteraceae bacterium]